MNGLQNNENLRLVPFYTENPGRENSYTLYLDAKTKEVFRAEGKKINASKFTFGFLVFFAFTRLFSVKILPFDNIFAFVIICLFIFILGLMLGYYLGIKMIDNIQKVTLSKEEWERYLSKGNDFYLRQIISSFILIILSVACFFFLYIFPSKWWFFGGIVLSVLAGTLSLALSKTRYDLYKNKIDITFNDGKEI